MRSEEIGKSGQTDHHAFLEPRARKGKKKELMTCLGVWEISICKYQMLFACISGVELLVRFIEFASTPKEVPTRVARMLLLVLILWVWVEVNLLLRIFFFFFPADLRLGRIIAMLWV
jgi:hypothetical protein